MWKTSFYGNTDPGKLRTNNEDAFIAQAIWDNNHVLAVAIDGVGGYDGGEVAAEIARKTIVEYLEKYPNGERLDLLKQAVVEANNEIYKERKIQMQFANMSCVLTACLVETEKQQINMVHVGDTRLYQYHRNELKKLSHDHSLVGYREEIGDLTEDEAMNHPQRNIISKDVGSEILQVNSDYIESKIFPLRANSSLLLCSDGLCDMLKSAEMLEVLQQNIPLNEKVQGLIDYANKKGGKDNVTVVLIEYTSDEPECDEMAISSENPNVRVKPIIAKEPEKQIDAIMKNSKKCCDKVKVTLLLLFALLLGFVGGWFTQEFYYSEPQVNSPRDTLSIPAIDTAKTEKQNEQ
jgi:serine/threonine protein phosphatase PrpC